MECLRLDHFAMICSNSVYRCGHMQNAPRFNSMSEMDSSRWLVNVRQQFADDKWPTECIRCQRSEAAGMESMRQREQIRMDEYKKLHPNPLKLNIEFDTVCNAACQICHPSQSTYYAKLLNVPVVFARGIDILQQVDSARVVDIEITGGEPVASTEVRRFLAEDISKYPLQRLRINSNGSGPLKEIVEVLDRGFPVTMTLSMDGTGKIFEYCRFPVKWDRFRATLNYYMGLKEQYENFYLELYHAISVLSLPALTDSIKFANQHGLPFSGTAIAQPPILQIQKNNFLSRFVLSNIEYNQTNKIFTQVATEQEDSSDELNAHIDQADKLRNISFDEYYRHLTIDRHL